MPSARAAPSRSAAMASTPEPVPTSSTDNCDTSSVCSAARHSRVVAWCPVQKPMEGVIKMTSGVGARGWGLAAEPASPTCPAEAPARRRKLRGPWWSGGGGLAVTRGEIVRRPTVTGCKSACDRRAQSSSGTSMAATWNSGVSEDWAVSRADAVEKNTRIESVRSSTAVGEKSSIAAYRRSGSAARISRAGYAFNSPDYPITQFPNFPIRLSEHVLDAIEQIPLVLLIFAWARFEFLGRQHIRELVEQVSLFARQFSRCQHLDGREQVAASASRDVGHPLASQP